MAPKRRKSTVEKENAPAIIDTTAIFEAIDADGDIMLRLTQPLAEEMIEDEDEDISGVSIKAEADTGSSHGHGERWNPPPNVDLLVSSKHLTLASPVFKEMIAKSPELLVLPNDDLEAFKIVLNIIHGRARQVPLVISVLTLRNIALIVEKYRMMEVVELYVKIWMKELYPPPAEDFERELLRWICICWIFRLPTEFKSITRRAVWETSSKVEIPRDENLNFPSRILDRIESQRKNVLYAMAFVVQKITDKCIYEGGICTQSTGNDIKDIERREACDAMILGSLLKSASDNSMWPIPKDPYRGITVQSIMDSARELRIQSLCDILNGNSGHSGHPDHGAHGYSKSIKRAIEKREMEAVGLELTEFVSVV